MKFTASLAFAGIAAAIYAIPAVAHHSFAMFDANQVTNLEGTVKEFQWTNPHAWIMLTERPGRLGTPGLASEDPDPRHAGQDADSSAA